MKHYFSLACESYRVELMSFFLIVSISQKHGGVLAGKRKTKNAVHRKHGKEGKSTDRKCIFLREPRPSIGVVFSGVTANHIVL
jgi:hypothetical protein